MSKKNIFIDGAIPAQFIADSIAKHQSKTRIGAHNIFLGQVRADTVDKKTVTGIEFSHYEEMAEKKVAQIREDAFDKFDLVCMHVYHSIGKVAVGEICIFVFVSAGHRPHVYEATEYIVNRIKTEVPLFGKEYFDDADYQWKKNG
ncbi:molybdenum cofactor biosynthesis protein MoaE [Flavimarina sp. Hel_I_48]|uniref:molybdenum cofactor biosynthesis protein MoaE n=1 Tax=Flavimarina sp. Hel_I_48 TaxID=1392488 RepID=UPI0004DFC61F|nr:molybdenum cofactor biosynthesis protein MoaE [Flavimarina sp. Hel_I_48]